MILEVRNLHVSYGSLKVLRGVNFHVGKGEFVALLGPNGAGKTTVLRAIVGTIREYGGRIDEGNILFEGKSIKGLPPYVLVRRGIGYVPQGRRVFPTLTVKENLEMGGFTIKDKSALKNRINEVFELFPILREREKQQAGTLSGGEQQMLSIARALVLDPRLLILDEPLLGLSPNYIKEVMEKIKQIQEKKNVSMLMIEHNAKIVMKYANRIYTLYEGKVKL